RVRQDIALGEAVELQATPTIFIDGHELRGALPAPILHAALDAFLADAGRRKRTAVESPTPGAEKGRAVTQTRGRPPRTRTAASSSTPGPEGPPELLGGRLVGAPRGRRPHTPRRPGPRYGHAGSPGTPPRRASSAP